MSMNWIMLMNTSMLMKMTILMEKTADLPKNMRSTIITTIPIRRDIPDLV